MKRILLSSALVVVTAVVTVIVMQQYSRYQRSRMADQAAKTNGYFWGSLTQGEKVLYVDGFLAGYWTGHVEVCETEARLAQPPWKTDRLGECMDRMRTYTKHIELEYYVDQINQYYQRYPEDRTVYVSSLILFLSDQENKSLEEIHRWKQGPETN